MVDDYLYRYQFINLRNKGKTLLSITFFSDFNICRFDSKWLFKLNAIYNSLEITDNKLFFINYTFKEILNVIRFAHHFIFMNLIWNWILFCFGSSVCSFSLFHIWFFVRLIIMIYHWIRSSLAHGHWPQFISQTKNNNCYYILTFS